MSYRTSSAALAALLFAAGLPLAAQASSGLPMKVGGLWCGVGLLHEFRLELAQQFNLLEARLVRKNRVRQITGRIEGNTVLTDPQRNHTLELQALGNELRVTAGTGPLAILKGQAFTRAIADSCTR
ncbi:hypothetical protein WG902_14110 [Ramlibacter sp. PS3R-8]|uniref:hypothetical protein n=1 Tax=Ramlibacter sp. PS3R-8 TaxID=3133437 RepID=UPI0030A02088